MYDLEGIGKATSETQRNLELSESSRDYFNEVRICFGMIKLSIFTC